MPKYELIQADCLEAMKDIAPGSVDLILTDPPYGTTQCKWDAVIPFEPMWTHISALLRNHGAAIFTASQPFTSALVMSNPKAFRFDISWNKVLSSGHLNAKRRPMRQHEDILVFSFGKAPNYFPIMRKGKPLHGEGSRIRENSENYGAQSGVYLDRVGETKKYPTTCITFQKDHASNTVHPTQKPVALMEYLIQTYSRSGETVLDFTMGSGTTGVAAMNTGRDFIGIEREPEYFEIAKKRIEEAAREAEEWEFML